MPEPTSPETDNPDPPLPRGVRKSASPPGAFARASSPASALPLKANGGPSSPPAELTSVALTVIASSPDGILVFDRDLRCLYSNPALERLTGVKPNVIAGRTTTEIQWPPCLDGLDRRVKMAMSGESILAPDNSFQSPVTGRLVWTSVRYFPLREPTGAVHGVVVSMADITRRKEIEASLASSEEAYRVLFEGNPQPAWVCEHDSLAFLAANEAAVRLYGYTREEFLGLSLRDISAPGDPEGQQAAALDPSGDLLTSQLVRHRRKDGSWIDVELSSRPLAFHNRLARLILALDVTERRLAEEQLRQSEERHRLLVELCPDGIFVLVEQRFTFANEAGVRLLGAATPKEVLGRPIQAVVAPGSQSQLQAHLDQLLTRGGQLPVTEMQFLRMDGVRIDVEVLATSLWFQNARAVQIIVRDITARKRLEIELRRSSANFQRIFQGSPAALGIVTLPDGRLIDVNEAFSRISGFSRDELLGRTISDLRLWREVGRRTRLLERLETQGAIRNLEASLRMQSGGVRQILLSGEKIELSEGPCLLFIAVDVTDRALLEEQLRQANKMEAVVQLAGGLAHSFNNLLSVIQANASLLQVRERLSPRGLESLDLLLKSATRGANLIKQILTLSRRRPIQPSPLNLNELVQALAPAIRQTLGGAISLELRTAAELPSIQADRQLLEQVISNLVANAREAMPDAGRLTLTTDARQFDDPQFSGRVLPGGVYVRLEVRDTGEGIAPEVLPRIFEPFFTTRHQAKTLGLGLAIVHGVIQQHQGWVEVDSTPGEGTSVAIYLPAAAPAPPSPTLPAAPSEN